MIKYVAPVLTALRSEQEVDVESCLRLYGHLIKNEIDGIAVFGTSGEFPHLPVSEKKKLIKAAAPVIKGHAEFIVGTGSMNVDDTVEMSRFAFENGADTVIVVGPYYYGLSDDSIFEYFSKVASHLKGNIYLYNFPDRTSYSINAQTVLRLVRKYPNIVGIKDTITNMSNTVDIIKLVKPEFPEFQVFHAYDNCFAYTVLAGGNGAVGILPNIAPKLFSNWAKAAREKDFDTLSAIQKKVDIMMDILWFHSPFLATVKAVLVQQGIFAEDTMTFPFLKFPEEKKAELSNFMKQFEA
ncbi:MAG: dihydrodipicolinate synthase family protein [Dysgonamonadaceae bacterium]|jgi:4-hydroxy-tetrahydrodipicolinate synthase|nr:dihydrodipicolinate synthase family protein [Dysgonamonadaceae bacterium]